MPVLAVVAGVAFGTGCEGGFLFGRIPLGVGPTGQESEPLHLNLGDVEAAEVKAW